MHNTRCVRAQKRCTIRTCLRLSGPLHRTSTSSHGGEATGTRMREPYPCPRQRHGSAHTRAPTTEATHPAPVAQWIEQAPSKRLAAGSSPAGGAPSPPSFGRAFLLVRAGSCPSTHRASRSPRVPAGAELRTCRPPLLPSATKHGSNVRAVTARKARRLPLGRPADPVRRGLRRRDAHPRAVDTGPSQHQSPVTSLARRRPGQPCRVPRRDGGGSGRTGCPSGHSFTVMGTAVGLSCSEHS